MDVFELLDSKFDICKQIDGLNTMLYEEPIIRYNSFSFTFAAYFELRLFRQWENNMGRISIKECLTDLGLFTSDGHIAKIQNESNAYLSLQFNYNIIQHALLNKKAFNSCYWDDDKFFGSVAHKIKYILSHTGLQAKKHPKKDYYIMTPHNEKVKTIANYANEDIAFLLYEYNSPLLKGNINEKRRILKLLSNEYEPIIRKKSKTKADFESKVYDSLGTIFNNFEIRHSNIDSNNKSYYKPRLTQYSNSQWEEIYDMACELILDVALISSYTEVAKKLEQYKCDINNI